MAFINITLTRKRPSPILIILDQLMIVSCDTVITLTAEVPIQVRARTFLWEQLSGTIVTWLTDQDEESATFQQSLVKDDKVFRFWVNKGAVDEVYEDILVTAIPRDVMPATSASVNNVTTRFVDENVAVATIIPGLSPEGSVSVDNAARGIKYNMPTVTDTVVPPYSNYVDSLLVYDVTGGIAETLITSYPPAPYHSLVHGFFNGPITNRNYRVDMVMNVDGIVHQARGKPAGHYTPTPWGYSDMDTWDRGRVHLANGKMSAVVTRTVYSIISQVESTDFAHSLLNTSQAEIILIRDVTLNPLDVPSSDTYNKFTFTLDAVPDIDDNLYMSLFDGPSSTNVTRLDLGIGGIG